LVDLFLIPYQTSIMPFAIITGASKGIGRSIATELASRHWDLLLVARTGAELASLSRELEGKFHIKAPFLELDLARDGASLAILEWCDRNGVELSALVNNAGYGIGGSFESNPLPEHLAMMRVNMNVPIELSHLLLGRLKKQSRAYILNIASSAAYQAVPGLSLYAASKAFVLSFSRGLSHELKNSGVTVTCICPGSTDTQFVDRAGMGEKARKLAKKVNMTPDEVAKISVNAMLSGKTEVIPGVVNKLGGFLTWLLPKSTLENAAKKIYEP
jgi:uncharacterized protein